MTDKSGVVEPLLTDSWYFVCHYTPLFAKMLPNIAVGVIGCGMPYLLQAPLPALASSVAVGQIGARTDQAPELLTAISTRPHHLMHRGKAAPVVLAI
jgi:hypothetical protein